MNLKAESGFGAWWVISALGFQLAQSRLIPLLASPYFQSSPHTFSLFLASSPSPSCLDENISSPRTNTKVSNEPYPPPHFRLPGHVPIPLFQYSCLWGHWVWEREKGCRSGLHPLFSVYPTPPPTCLTVCGIHFDCSLASSHHPLASSPPLYNLNPRSA